MFGNNHRVTPLESRKQLLIAESELNRAQLVEDLTALSERVHALASRAKSLGSVASTATMLVTALVAFRRRKPQEEDASHSWAQTILRGAGLISRLWLAFRARSE